MNDLFKIQRDWNGGATECLGEHFDSDQARREYFLALLAKKLKDPSFRNQDGFPTGSDEAILAMSDPPYYTACPNPWLADFIKHYGRPHDSTETYSREPYATDVTEGKNDPIYNAHNYHTKVPHKAIMRYILHYTQPGDVVLDAFCGTGMTGIAGHLCGDRAAVENLGYRVSSDGIISEVGPNASGQRPFSLLGVRRAVLNDISPSATFIARNYNTPSDMNAFRDDATHILREAEEMLGWMYETVHTDGKTPGRINYTVWSDVFSCGECAGEIVYWDVALDQKARRVLSEFQCPHCSALQSKRSMDRIWVTKSDRALGKSTRRVKQVPVLINYSINRSRFEKQPDEFDLEVLRRIEQTEITDWYPSTRMIAGSESRRNDIIGMTHVHHFFTHRTLAVMSRLMKFARDKPDGALLRMALLDGFSVLTRMSRFRAPAWFDKSTGPMKGWTAGTLYVPSLQGEQNVFNAFAEKVQMITRSFTADSSEQFISTGHSGALAIPSNSVDYVFLDPPFGANLNYSELNCLWESWLQVFTNSMSEAIENRAHGKTLDDYRHLMTSCLREVFRVLKPGRWLTIEFSNTRASVWNAIQTAIQEAGFVVANVSALNKKQGSFKAVTTPTAVKQDLVISAYKPNGGLEERFSQSGGTEDSVWDFVRSHLGYLPTVKKNASQLEFISERDPRILFDRVVAWFVRHNMLVPMSGAEFRARLHQRFVERDGMIFLPEQAAEYDRRRQSNAVAPQMELFVSDERSAISWLADFLKSRPSTYQSIHPDFIVQLGVGWKRHEAKPELSALLEDNFLRYDGTSDVPSQIHSYLSTNFRELRGLDKTDPRLKAKAQDRWYVPDPNKAQDLEKKREKALLKEFDEYAVVTTRKLKEFRLEALRAGFKSAWGRKDYTTIIKVAQKIPDDALQEDEKLLLWYDQALTRMEAGA